MHHLYCVYSRNEQTLQIRNHIRFILQKEMYTQGFIEIQKRNYQELCNFLSCFDLQRAYDYLSIPTFIELVITQLSIANELVTLDVAFFCHLKLFVALVLNKVFISLSLTYIVVCISLHLHHYTQVRHLCCNGFSLCMPFFLP